MNLYLTIELVKLGRKPQNGFQRFDFMRTKKEIEDKLDNANLKGEITDKYRNGFIHALKWVLEEDQMRTEKEINKFLKRIGNLKGDLEVKALNAGRKLDIYAIYCTLLWVLEEE